MKIKMTTKNQQNWIELDTENAIMSAEIESAVASLKNKAVSSVETISGLIIARAE